MSKQIRAINTTTLIVPGDLQVSDLRRAIQDLKADTIINSINVEQSTDGTTHVDIVYKYTIEQNDLVQTIPTYRNFDMGEAERSIHAEAAESM